MATTISDYLSSAPLTDELEALSEVQRPDDFESTDTTRSTNSTPSRDIDKIDWSRLHGYIATPRLSKRPKSFIWMHGYKVKDIVTNQEYWLCKLCHNRRPHAREPTGHIYRCASTTTATLHLEKKHRIGQYGEIPVKSPITTQRTIDSFDSLLRERNTAIAEFDLAYFKALLVRLFTVEQLALVKVESAAFRDLLVYLEPKLRGSIPSRRSLTRYIGHAYEKSLLDVEIALTGAKSKINLSFDLWTSPGRRLSLLGIVAHYLDAQWKPVTVLLALPRMQGRHTGVSIAEQIHAILTHFRIANNFGHAIADNASENTACLDHLSELLHMNLDSRRVMCMGHIINLVAQQCLWGSDVDAFEEELTNVTAEELELREWRKRGPIGKLHNLIRYATHSSKRRDLLETIQRIQYRRLQSSQTSTSQPLKPLRVYALVHDNLTRWNSWYDAAVRAVLLRSAIDEFIDSELGDYRAAVARYEGSRSLQKRPPKEPSLLADLLTTDDWSIITQYVELLKPLKDATVLLQGHVSITGKGAKPVRGAIWQVLPIFESMMAAFENARERHLPAATLASQSLQQPSSQSSAPSPPPTTPPPVRSRITRSSQSIPITRISATTDSSASQDTPVVSEEQLTDSDEAATPGDQSEKHFSTNINLGWQKLDAYYLKTDASPIYTAAVVLHPRLKWRWFDRYWAKKPAWRKAAKEKVAALWAEYKDASFDDDGHTTLATSPTAIRDEWSSPDDQIDAADQFTAYIAEGFAQVATDQSPIPYWISKLTVWPQLAQMALDVYSTPAMSDEPERVFSSGGALLVPRRRQLSAGHVREILCLRSWQDSGIVTLNAALFEQVVKHADGAPIAEDLRNNTYENDDEVIYDEHE
jgi:hypothetical protein